MLVVIHILETQCNQKKLCS